MTNHSIGGVLPVLHTPFIDGQAIDWDSLQREVDFAFDVGSQGIVAAMVSEYLRLTHDEKIELTERLVELADGRGAVITSVGSESIAQSLALTRRESIAQSLALTRHAESAGCDAVMAIPPIATAAGEDQLWRYFCEIGDHTNLPLIVQDASSYVGGTLAIDLFVRLLDRFGADKVLFKPEAEPI